MRYEKFFSWRSAVLNSSLPPTTRHVLLTLACHMNDAGESCYPSIARLCRETGLSNRTVITHLDLAESLAWLRVDRDALGGQKWRTKSYQISWPSDPEAGEGGSPPFDKKLVKEVHHLSAEAGEGGSPPFGVKVVNLLHEGGEPDDKKVVKEVHSSTPVSTPTTQPPLAPPAPEVENPPPGLDQTAWHRWLDYRRQIRKPLKPASLLAAQRKLAALGTDQAAVVEQSIANGWQGLFALKPGGKHAAREQTDNSAIGQIRAANQRAREREAAQRGNTSPAVGAHGNDLRPPLEGQFRHER